jgi:hypothetical protein
MDMPFHMPNTCKVSIKMEVQHITGYFSKMKKRRGENEGEDEPEEVKQF